MAKVLYKIRHSGSSGVITFSTYSVHTSSEYYWANPQGRYFMRYDYTYDTSTGVYTEERYQKVDSATSTYRYTGSSTKNIKTDLDRLYYPGQTINFSRGYYAIWEKKPGFTINFNTNGATSVATSTDVENITLPSISRPGYTFDGWYNGGTRIGDSGDKWVPTADATITAHWTPITYTIRYVLYGGEVSGNPETYTIETPTFTLNNPTQDNQVFTGWTDAGKVGTKASNISESTEPKTSFQIVKGQYGDRVFTANWKSTSWKNPSGTGNDDDADKTNQKRDTTESKVKRNRIKIG